MKTGQINPPLSGKGHSEDAKSPCIPGKFNAPQAHQTPMSLPIYMGTGMVALCNTDPVSWAQTLMLPHPVETNFHIKPNAGTKSSIDELSVGSLLPGREVIFVPGC